jgi:hypothetical protein
MENFGEETVGKLTIKILKRYSIKLGCYEDKWSGPEAGFCVHGFVSARSQNKFGSGLLLVPQHRGKARSFPTTCTRIRFSGSLHESSLLVVTYSIAFTWTTDSKVTEWTADVSVRILMSLTLFLILKTSYWFQMTDLTVKWTFCHVIQQAHTVLYELWSHCWCDVETFP